jgi:hypothetical protein
MGMTPEFHVWHPAGLFDQAWEHLRPVLREKGRHIALNDCGSYVFVECSKWPPPEPRAFAEAPTPALAFCLAAYAAIEGKAFAEASRDGHS